MAGRKVLSLDEKIVAAEENVVRTKEKYNEALKCLDELMKEKKAIQNEELIRLFWKSPRTYEEMMTFLKEGMTDAQIKNATRKKPGRRPKN